jgi:hypothetical protein
MMLHMSLLHRTLHNTHRRHHQEKCLATGWKALLFSCIAYAAPSCFIPPVSRCFSDSGRFRFLSIPERHLRKKSDKCRHSISNSDFKRVFVAPESICKSINSCNNVHACTELWIEREQKVHLSLCTLRMHVGAWKFSSAHSEPRN